MILFQEYRPSFHLSRHHVLRIHLIGLLPLGLSLLLLFAHGARSGPGLWTALGLSIGLELLLWGAYHLRHTEDVRSTLGDRLVVRLDEWFPVFAFVIQSILIDLCLVILWVTITELGFPSSVWHHFLFALFILLLPYFQWIHEVNRMETTPRREWLEHLSRSLMIINIAIIVASMVQALVQAQSEPFDTDPTPIVLIIWIIAILVVLSAMVLFMGKTVNIRRQLLIESTRSASPATPPKKHQPY